MKFLILFLTFCALAFGDTITDKSKNNPTVAAAYQILAKRKNKYPNVKILMIFQYRHGTNDLTDKSNRLFVIFFNKNILNNKMEVWAYDADLGARFLYVDLKDFNNHNVIAQAIGIYPWEHAMYIDNPEILP